MGRVAPVDGLYAYDWMFATTCFGPSGLAFLTVAEAEIAVAVEVEEPAVERGVEPDLSLLFVPDRPDGGRVRRFCFGSGAELLVGESPARAIAVCDLLDDPADARGRGAIPGGNRDPTPPGVIPFAFSARRRCLIVTARILRL